MCHRCSLEHLNKFPFVFFVLKLSSCYVLIKRRMICSLESHRYLSEALSSFVDNPVIVLVLACFIMFLVFSLSDLPYLLCFYSFKVMFCRCLWSHFTCVCMYVCVRACVHLQACKRERGDVGGGDGIHVALMSR